MTLLIRTISMLLILFLVACSNTSLVSPKGMMTEELGDGRWEITYSTEVKLPSGGRVTSTPMKGPIEAEAKRLCSNGYVPFEIAPVSLGAGPNGQGLFTRTSAIVECNPSDPAS